MTSLTTALLLGSSITIVHTIGTSPVHNPIKLLLRCSATTVMRNTALMCAKNLKKDKDKYSLSRAEIAKYLERLLKNARKSNVTINEAALSSRPQESTYSVDEAEQLIGGMQLSDTSSDSE